MVFILSGLLIEMKCFVGWRLMPSDPNEIRKPATLNYINNITYRKRVEEGLRRNETDLRESQRMAHVGSCRLDIATNLVV